MLIIPAIDIMEEKVVRLEQGDFNKVKSYQGTPVETALKWEKKGAKFLHLIDLDGAREGRLKNADMIAMIIKNVRIKCEVGGGLRDVKDIEYFLKNGANRVVLGTKVLEDRDYLEKVVSKFNEKIVVSVDFKGDKVVKMGWQKETDLKPRDVIVQMQDMGVRTVIVTDITLDGTLKGVGIERLKEILETVNISIIVSGGISSLEDVRNIKKIWKKNLEGLIIGKALYEGKVDLEEAIEVAGAKI